MIIITRSRILEFLCRPEARGTAVSLDSTNEDRQDLKSFMITIVVMTMMSLMIRTSIPGRTMMTMLMLMITTSIPGRTSVWMTTTKDPAAASTQFSVSQMPPSRGTKPGLNPPRPLETL